MNDLERMVRDTLQRRQDDVPSVDASDARRVAGLARRRQARNVVVGMIAGAAVVIVAVAGFGGLVRADRPPTFVDQLPSPSPSVATSQPQVVATLPPNAKIRPWPCTTQNPAGVYSWDHEPDDPVDTGCYSGEGYIHNAYGRGSNGIQIWIKGVPGELILQRGQTAVMAGREGTYRRYIGRYASNYSRSGKEWVVGGSGADGQAEEWMLDIQGTTVTITLTAKPWASEADLAEAHEIIESILIQPWNNDLGFRLVFTLTTNTWSSG